MEARGADVALELADGGEGDVVLEPAEDVDGRQREDIGAVTTRPEGPADVVAELDLGEAFVDVGS